jgi:hypothetical protein
MWPAQYLVQNGKLLEHHIVHPPTHTRIAWSVGISLVGEDDVLLACYKSTWAKQLMAVVARASAQPYCS